MAQDTTSHPVTLEDAAQAFAALGSEQRLSVLRMLVRAGPKGATMGELAERCNIGASTLTHHIRFLSQAGLVEQKKEGRSIICAAASYTRMSGLIAFLLAECCQDQDT